MTDKPRIGTQLRKLPCVLHARGDEETAVRFHVDDIGQVLALLKPYRRRQVSEAEKERLAELSHRHGVSAKRISERQHSELGATNAGR